MDLQEMINHIAAGNSVAAKESIENVLSAKAFDALQSRKQEIASTLFGGQEQESEEIADDEEAVYEEEVEVDGEQLDELSKATLTRYKTKASVQAHDAKSELDNLKHSPDGGDRAIARDAGKTYVKRTMGAAQAARKLNYGKYSN